MTWPRMGSRGAFAARGSERTEAVGVGLSLGMRPSYARRARPVNRFK